MKTTSPRSEAGFTLLEVLISAGIVLAVMAAAMGAQSVATGQMNETVARSLLREAAEFGVKEVAHDARWCDAAALILSQSNGSSRLDLRLPVDYVAGAPVWSAPITVEVVPSPIDANGNGVLDEWRLVRTADGVTRVLCDHLITGGFTATRAGNSVTLQLRLRRAHRGRPLTATVGTTVSLRN
jgi:type II secretory pathway pseudopilin PulG